MSAEALAALDAVRLHATSGGQQHTYAGLDDDTRMLLTFADSIGASVAFAAELSHQRLTDRLDVTRAVTVAASEARTVAGFLTLAPMLFLPLTANILNMSVWAFYRSPAGRAVLMVAGVLYLVGLLTVRVLIRRLHGSVVAHGSAGHGWMFVLLGAVWLFAGFWFAVACGVLLWLVVRRRHTDTYALADLSLAADVLMVAVSAGVSLPLALRYAAVQVVALSAPLRRLAYSLDVGVEPDDDGPLGLFAARVWQAHSDGAPTVRLLEQFARQLRADERGVRLARTARLPSQLTVPTTMLFLPATVLVMLAPVVAYGASALT